MAAPAAGFAAVRGGNGSRSIICSASSPSLPMATHADAGVVTRSAQLADRAACAHPPSDKALQGDVLTLTLTLDSISLAAVSQMPPGCNMPPANTHASRNCC